jgi:hypothetical protein
VLNRSIFKIRVLVTGDDVCCFIKKLLLKEDEGTIRNQSENGGVFTQTWKFAAAQMGLCHVIFYYVCDLYINERPEPQTTANSCFVFGVDLFGGIFFKWRPNHWRLK